MARIAHLISLTGLLLGAALGLGACLSPTEPNTPSRSDPAAYIRGDHPRLLIELDVAEGVAPRDGVGEILISTYAPLLDKPGGIEIRLDETLPARGPDYVWTFEEVDAYARARFDQIGEEDEAVIHTLWLDGRYQSPSGAIVLGIGWASRFLAIFPDVIAPTCEDRPLLGPDLCREAEAAIWTHEMGHVIGLVNNGIPMVEDHEDPDHPGHASDEEDIMYWAFEGVSGADLLASRMMGGEPAFSFAPASVADIMAFREAR